MVSSGLFWNCVDAHGGRNLLRGWVVRAVEAVIFVSTLPASVIYAGVIYRFKDSKKARRVLWVALLLVQWVFLLLTLWSYFHMLGAYLRWHRPAAWLAPREHWISVFLVIGLVALYGLLKFRCWARLLYVFFICGTAVFCLADRLVLFGPDEQCYCFTDWTQLSLLLILQVLTLTLSYTKTFASSFQPTASIEDTATTKP
jgi:hypothetical protein